MIHQLVRVLIIALILAMLLWAVAIMAKGLTLAVALLRSPLTDETTRSAPALQRIAAALLVALGVIVVGAVLVTAVLVIERQSEDFPFRAAIAQLERDVHDGLVSMRGRLVGSR